MKELSDITCAVVDHGLFPAVAQRMAMACKRVLYHTPVECAYPTLNSYIIGDGYGEIERCDDIWDPKNKNEVDLWIFPDVGFSGTQLELESQGLPVWGSKAADSIELNRQKFNRVLKEVGLPVAKHVVVKGLTNLRLLLVDATDRYIKISKYRGTMETTHWRDYDLDSGWLDSMAVKLGPAQDLLTFLVFEPIDTGVEIGGDTYCVGGKWPSFMLHGDEDKDKAYIGAVTPYAEMPEDLRNVMEAFSPILAADRYCNQWSMEDRDGKFIDATTRGGLPSTKSQLNTWSNFPEIVWFGAHGELIEPLPAAQFSVECILSLKGRKDEWKKTRIDGKLVEHCAFANCCEIDGAICFPPDGGTDEAVGWLQAGGDTIEDAIEAIHKLADMLPEGLTAATDCLPGLLAKIHAGEKEGVEFADKIPEPESMVKL